MAEAKFQTTVKVSKVDSKLGLVMGFGLITKEKGKEYFDLQGDHVSDDEMLSAALNFAESARVASEMHVEKRVETARGDLFETLIQKGLVPEDAQEVVDATFPGVTVEGVEKAAAPRGTVVFLWPMTEEVAKAFDVETETTGLMIAMKPDAAMLERFEKGELTGFSIGGAGIRVPVAEEA